MLIRNLFLIFLLISCTPIKTVPLGTELDIKCEKVNGNNKIEIFCRPLEYDFEYLNKKGVYVGRICPLNESDTCFQTGCTLVSKNTKDEIDYLKVVC